MSEDKICGRSYKDQPVNTATEINKQEQVKLIALKTCETLKVTRKGFYEYL